MNSGDIKTLLLGALIGAVFAVPAGILSYVACLMVLTKASTGDWPCLF